MRDELQGSGTELHGRNFMIYTFLLALSEQ